MNTYRRGTTSGLHTARVLLSISLLFAATTVWANPAKVNRAGLDAGVDHQRFIVQFDAATRGNASRVQQQVAAVATERGLGLGVQRQLATGAHLVAVDRALPSAAATALMEAFARRAGVDYVEADAMMQPVFEPNDQHYGVQWHYKDKAVEIGGFNLPGAWDLGAGAGVVVAVLDTGRTNHVDLAANLVAGYDFISDTFVSRDGNGRDSNPNDEGDWTLKNECGRGSQASNSSWHGTHVAGTVAAVTHNTTGVAGVAYLAKVQPLRVLGRCGGYLSDIADAIIWAAGGTVSGVPANTITAQVINMSLGGSGSCGSTYQDAINYAVNNGTTVVVSAGNSNVNASNSRPANCNNVITVAASDRTGSRASYSNYGTTVEITAPGGGSGNGVASTINTGSTVQGADGYAYYQGTSMAAPHISGLAAILYGLDPEITPAEVLQLIQANARPMPGSCSGGCGAGLADAAATVQALDPGDPPENQPPTANFSFSCTNLSCNFIDSSGDSDGSIASRSWNFGDGGTSAATNPSRTYATAGTYTVQLTVTDNDGATNSISKQVSVADSPTNLPPTANFNSSCTNLSCNFTNTSTDSDGTIAGSSWTFGDGGTSTATHPSRTYAAAGNYTVQLTVTDDDGATHSISKSVTATAPPSGVNLVGSAVSSGSTWTAIATDSNGGTLTGSWSLGGGSCSANQCSRTGIPKRTGSVIFTATTGQSITISKP